MQRIRTCSNLAGKGGGRREGARRGRHDVDSRAVSWARCASVGDRHASQTPGLVATAFIERSGVASREGRLGVRAPHDGGAATALEGTGEAMTYPPGSPGYPPAQ